MVGLVAALYWKVIGSKQKVGQACAAHAECAEGTLCFNSRCTSTCESDVRCDPQTTCVNVLYETVAAGQSGRHFANGMNTRNLCVPEEDAARLRAEYRQLFQH